MVEEQGLLVGGRVAREVTGRTKREEGGEEGGETEEGLAWCELFPIERSTSSSTSCILELREMKLSFEGEVWLLLV